MAELEGLLRNIFLFDGLSHEELQVLLPFCSRLHLKSGQHLFHEGDTALAFFAVLTGKLKIYKLSARGEEQVLHFPKTHDLVAEAVIFERKTFPAHCQAINDSELVRIDGEHFRSMVSAHPELSFKLLSGYAKRLRHFVHMIEDLTLRNTQERLVRYLLSHIERDSNPPRCLLEIPKKDLASLLGTIPETLSRALRDLKNQGLIEEKGKYIEILERDSLSALV